MPDVVALADDQSWNYQAFLIYIGVYHSGAWEDWAGKAGVYPIGGFD